MKTRVFAVCAVIFMFCGIIHTAIADGLINIPIDLNNFQTVNNDNCKLELTSEGIKVFNCGYRAGWFGAFTKNTYNLVGSEVFIKFKPFGDGQYVGFGLAVVDTAATHYLVPSDRSFPFGTTHHSYNGSVVINDGTWYFGRFKVKTDKTFETTLSTGNYDSNGGTPIQHVTGTISNTDWDAFRNARLGLNGGDNYSAAAYAVLGELRIVPTTSCSNEAVVKPYTFTSGNPAKATEVNANFDAIYTQMNCQIQALKAIVCTDHPTASICQ